jgi:hypothetical protein
MVLQSAMVLVARSRVIGWARSFSYGLHGTHNRQFRPVCASHCRYEEPLADNRIADSALPTKSTAAIYMYADHPVMELGSRWTTLRPTGSTTPARADRCRRATSDVGIARESYPNRGSAGCPPRAGTR